MGSISLCTVVIDGLHNYLDIMIMSALKKLTFLHEIIICNIQAEGPEKQEKIGNVLIRRINVPIFHKYATFSNISESYIINNFGHALGLHECIDRSQAKYILFCDPDVIFYTAVDELYIELISKHNLNYIGCAHESANKLVYDNFPYLANSLVRRTDLPGDYFLKNNLCFQDAIRITNNVEIYEQFKKATGKYLIRGAIPEFVDKFEIPTERTKEVDFDTGCNLYLWAKEKNWRWLSFLSYDCQNYKTSYYRSNFNLKDKFKIQKLIHHQFSRFRKSEENSFLKFKQIYNESQEIEMENK